MSDVTTFLLQKANLDHMELKESFTVHISKKFIINLIKLGRIRNEMTSPNSDLSISMILLEIHLFYNFGVEWMYEPRSVALHTKVANRQWKIWPSHDIECTYNWVRQRRDIHLI